MRMCWKRDASRWRAAAGNCWKTKRSKRRIWGKRKSRSKSKSKCSLQAEKNLQAVFSCLHGSGGGNPELRLFWQLKRNDKQSFLQPKLPIKTLPLYIKRLDAITSVFMRVCVSRLVVLTTKGTKHKENFHKLLLDNIAKLRNMVPKKACKKHVSSLFEKY